MALALTSSLHGLAASGHFPRTPADGSGPGPVILFGSIAAVIVCLLAGIATAARLVPWYAAVIGGGLAVLLAPLVLQRFTDNFVNGRAALLVFAAIGAVLALALVSMSGGLTFP